MAPCRVFLASFALLVLTLPAAADQTETVMVKTANTEIVLSRENGRYAPLNKAQKEALKAALQTRLRGAGFASGRGRVIHRTDQTAQYQTGEAHAMITVATLDAEGALSTTCVQGVDEAVRVLSQETSGK